MKFYYSKNLPCLHKHQPIFVRELFRLLVCHVPLGLQVGFVPNQENHLKCSKCQNLGLGTLISQSKISQC